MKRDTSKIGAFEAKTHLPELLRQTASGKSFVIHRRGKPVARLVPPVAETPPETPSNLVVEFRSIRERVRGSVRVRDLVKAGRRR